MSAEPAPPGTFFLNPDYRHYESGEYPLQVKTLLYEPRSTSTFEVVWLRLFYGFGIAMFVTSALINLHAVVGMIFLIMVCSFTVLFISSIPAFMIDYLIRRWRAEHRLHRLKKTWQLIHGEIVESGWHIKTYYRSSRKDTVTNITYQFVSPTGRTLTGKQSWWSPETHNRKIPPAGTPVRVLYADDRTFVLL